jgi:hypothetical protein
MALEHFLFNYFISKTKQNKTKQNKATAQNDICLIGFIACDTIALPMLPKASKTGYFRRYLDTIFGQYLSVKKC